MKIIYTHLLFLIIAMNIAIYANSQNKLGKIKNIKLAKDEKRKETNVTDWSRYHKCLEDKDMNNQKNILHSTVLMRLQGKSVTFKCDICLPPLGTKLDDVIEWQFNSSSNDTLANLSVLNTDHTIIDVDGTLKIYNVEQQQAGHYWCKMNETISPPYFLHIDNGSEPIRIVHPEEAPKVPHSKPPTIMSKYNLKIYSEWTEWSPCSTCDVVGRKVRYGYCTILSLTNVPGKARLVSENSIETGEVYNNRIYESEEDEYDDFVKDKELQNLISEPESKIRNELDFAINTILPKYGNKVPCRSRYTPKVLQNLFCVKKRETEMMTRFCKIKCQKNIVFEVLNKYGKVLEYANNSAGIYSMLQKMPEVVPTITRTTVYYEHNSPCELKCPGNLNSDALIVWKIGSKKINPYLIKEQTSERIQINQYGSIIFKKVRFADANIYSCWQNNKIAGVIKLKVTHEIKIKLNHHVLMIGGIAIMSVFLLVFWRAFQGRKRFTKH